MDLGHERIGRGRDQRESARYGIARRGWILPDAGEQQRPAVATREVPREFPPADRAPLEEPASRHDAAAVAKGIAKRGPGGDPLGHQGLQLDGHALQGLDQLRRPHDVDAVVHGAVHHRRSHGPLLGRARRGRALARHLLRRGSLPLRALWHCGLCDVRRLLLLVAEVHRAHAQ